MAETWQKRVDIADASNGIKRCVSRRSAEKVLIPILIEHGKNDRIECDLSYMHIMKMMPRLLNRCLIPRSSH